MSLKFVGKNHLAENRFFSYYCLVTALYVLVSRCIGSNSGIAELAYLLVKRRVILNSVKIILHRIDPKMPRLNCRLLMLAIPSILNENWSILIFDSVVLKCARYVYDIQIYKFTCTHYCI